MIYMHTTLSYNCLFSIKEWFRKSFIEKPEAAIHMLKCANEEEQLYPASIMTIDVMTSSFVNFCYHLVYLSYSVASLIVFCISGWISFLFLILNGLPGYLNMPLSHSG